MTNGNGELSDDAKGRGVTVQECEGAGVRRDWSATGPGCDGAGARRDWGATGLRRERGRVRRCGTALDGTTRRKRAQPGATGRSRAQPGTEGGLAALQTL